VAITLIPLEVEDAVPTKIDVTDLTIGRIGGTGVFDVLMSIVVKYIDEEYTKNRITGKEYATVYLGAISSVLQQSIAFLALTQQDEKNNAEIALVRQKTVTELYNTSDNLIAGLGFNDSTVAGGLLGKQKEKLVAEIALTGKQSEKTDSETDLLEQKTVTELAQTADVIPADLGFNTSTTVSGTTLKQKDLYTAQTTGFTRDAEQKVLKNFLDTWAVRRTTDDATTVSGNGLADADIKKIVQKAAEGIGVTIT